MSDFSFFSVLNILDRYHTFGTLLYVYGVTKTYLILEYTKKIFQCSEAAGRNWGRAVKEFFIGGFEDLLDMPQNLSNILS